MKLLSAAAATAVLAWTAPALSAPPPASAFGRLPAVIDASISPDGKHLAMLGGATDQRIITIATIDQPGLPGVGLGQVEGVGLRWADNQHVLARLAYWLETGPREAYRMERTLAIDVGGHVKSRLLDHDGASGWLTGQPVLGSTTVDGEKRVVMMGLVESTGADAASDTHIARKGDSPFVRALFSVDPDTGRGKIIEKGNSDTVGWSLDADGAPRVRRQIDETTHHILVMGRAKGQQTYRPVWGGGDIDTADNYLGYSAAEDAIYVVENGELVRKRLADGATTAILQTPAGGSLSMIWDANRHSAVGVRTGGPHSKIVWLDPQIGAVETALAKALPDKIVDLENWSEDRTRFVVRVSSGSSPGVWYLFDAARKELSPVGEEYPELKGAALGAKHFFTYKARDGLEIPAYLTLPADVKPGAKPPLIVLPHGGPAARDDDDFDWLAQFLATRGYAVLQPQFRGSWGFGKSFEDAGKGEWGGKMQTDLLDGIAAVGAAGQADPSRVCIVGASFGGYAAMAGAALHSDRYRCAASFAGVSDLGLLLTEEGRLYGRDSVAVEEWREMLGGAPKDELDATSPLRQVDNVTIPLLLVHGDKDTVVAPEQSQLMADAMTKAGKPVQLVMLKGDNHYLTKTATRTQFLETLGDFLAKNLPVAP